MAQSFDVNILSSDKKIFEGKARSLTAPGELGYLGVLVDHAPLMTTLIPGKLTLTDDAGKVTTFDSAKGGFLRVLHNKATVLLD